MNKFNFFQRTALLLSLFMIFTMSVGSTLAYIVVETPSITNTFIPVVSPTVDDVIIPITVHKTVKNTGEDKIGAENFEFVLENVDTGEKTALKTDKDGLAVFELIFKESDGGKTFNYKLTESDEGRDGVTYSTAVYSIKINITLGDDGKLLTTTECNGVSTENVVAEFENIYHADVSETPPTGDSNLIFAVIALLSIAALIVTARKKRRI